MLTAKCNNIDKTPCIYPEKSITYVETFAQKRCDDLIPNDGQIKVLGFYPGKA